MSNKSLIIGVIIIVIIGIGLGLKFMDTKVETKPEVVAESDWLTFTDEAGVYTFQYPAKLPTTYIGAEDWPPLINLLEGSTFTCTVADNPTAHAGVTESRVINGREYCLTSQVEGAAGSTYTDYSYITTLNGQVIRLTFALREPQCDNYDSPAREACKEEQANFNLDELVGKTIDSLKFK